MPQITPIRGFVNTPVTKSICAASVVIALAILILVLKQYVHLAIDPFIVKYSQYWRVATFQFSVVNESDLILTIALWFHFKTLERLFGPRKYFSLVALLALYNAVATFMVLCVGQLATVYLAALLRKLVWRQHMELVYYDTVFNTVVPGPLGILALLYICHGTYIPVLYHFSILWKKPVSTETQTEGVQHQDQGKTLTLTNHFQVHLLFTMLMFNHGFGSAIPCLVGAIVGRLYTQDLLAGSRSWVLPLVVFQLFVAPHKVRDYTVRTFTRRWQGYTRVSGGEPGVEALPPVTDEAVSRAEEDESEVAIDDINHHTQQPAARSTSPVRPLGRQFLDTFRT